MKEKRTKIQTKKANENFFKKGWNHLEAKFGKGRTIYIGLTSVLCIILLLAITIIKQQRLDRMEIDAELARAMTYEQFQPGDETIEGTENVTFSAFFLRDINQDGYAEKIKGSAKAIGSEDTLYMELNVNTVGYLKDTTIQIDGKNFYLQTKLSKDEQLQDNYISNQTKEIKLNSMTNGMQKLLTGMVRSGDYTYDSKKNEAIGDNINNYSRNDNKIILTGTYVGEDGTETTIRKEISLTMDWYGQAYAEMNAKSQNYKDIHERIDEKNEIFTIEFNIETKERNKDLILSKNYVEGTIPLLNGYHPIHVDRINTVYGIGDFTYDQATQKFTITRTAEVADDGTIIASVPNENTYKIKVQYPLEAYRSIDYDTISINIPVKTYYEGYNNPNAEFKNPYQSNVAERTLIANYANFPANGDSIRFNVDIEKSDYNKDTANVISKRKPTRIYNGESILEKNDTYRVKWTVSSGPNGNSSGVIMKETENNKPQVSDVFIKADSTHDSMENMTTNIGIGFWGANNFLGVDGWIKVYDDETNNLIVTFTGYDMLKYTQDHLYYYPTPIKHVRVETSANNSNEYFYVHHMKELNDESITTHYTKEEFDNLQYIQSTVAGYAGGTAHTDTNQIKYEAEYATADLKISNNTISTQSTEKNEIITIHAKYDSTYNQIGWVDGSFLVKMPEEILTAEINNIEINNEEVAITNYEVIKKEGSNFIKINTQNSNRRQQDYQIDIDVNLTPDPRIASVDRNIELYASNGVTCDYQPSSEDIYDVDDNLNTTQKVMNTNTRIHFIAPSSLLTSQTISDYDDKGSMVVSPEIADVKPNYASVDNKLKQAKIGVQVKNNYANTVSETVILGKIPFAGNTYAFSNEQLGSTYTTKMTEEGIKIPEELEGKVAVYYSEKETPDKNLSNAQNQWKTKEQITNWDTIKTYLIDFRETSIGRGTQYIFYYTVQIPNGLNYNEVSYSHHGVYFCLDTLDGKYSTQIEPSKIGLRIAEKYNLAITKYQSKTDKLVPGATYCAKEVIDGVVAKEGRTAVTNAQGRLTIPGLYVAKTYEVQEIKTPAEYALNPDKIRYTTSVDANGSLKVEKEQGITKEDITVVQQEENIVTLQVEDEVKGKLKIKKQEKETGNRIGSVYYQITGAGLPEGGRALITDAYGESSLSGLSIEEEYTLQEIKATGYYLGNAIKFKIVNQEGNYALQIIEGDVKENSLTEENHIPTANLTFENEKIPTYDLEITKVGKSTDVTVNQTPGLQTPTNQENKKVLAGARFRLYKDNKEIGTYLTNEEGKIRISDLYQYVEGKPEEATYTLKEVVAPTGYTKIQDITFKVEEKEGILTFQESNDTDRVYTAEGNVIKLQIEDRPVFKLVKKDAETKEVIANAKFAIYYAENEEEPVRDSNGEIIGNKEIIGGKQYYTLTTNQNGEITADLQEGTYKAIEIQAPEKYQVTNQAYYFAIGSSEYEIGLQATWGQMTQTNTDDVCVVKTKDGGYITNNSTNITKYNSENEIQWQKQFQMDPYLYFSQGKTIVELQSGSFVTFYGDQEDGNETSHISKIVKLNTNGEVEKEERIEGIIYSITSSQDGGLAIVVDTKIEKYNENIEKQWEKNITNNKTEAQINQTKDGGFIIGVHYSGSTEEEVDLGDGCIIQVSSQGSILAKYTKEGTTEWGKFIPGYMTYIESLMETSDGNILVGGYSQEDNIDLGNGVVLNKASDINQQRYGMIIKYNRSGEPQWADKTESRDMSEFNTVIQTNDGGYLIGGYTNNCLILSNGQILGKVDGGHGGILIKYDIDGNIQWANTTTNQGDCQIKSVIEMDNGEYIVGGFYANYSNKGEFDLGNGQILTSNQGSKNVIMLRYQTTEQQQVATFRKAETIGASGKDAIQTAIKTQDGGYITVGYFGKNIALKNGQILTNHGDLDGMIIKYNENEEIQWAKSVGGAGKDYLMSVVETQDKGYLIGGCMGNGNISLENGETLSNTNGVAGILVKYDENGMVQWSKVIEQNGSSWINSVTTTQDGGYLIGGSVSISGNNTIDFGNGIGITNPYHINGYTGFVLKYNHDGEAQWVKTVQGSTSTYMDTVLETQDGGYVVGGRFENQVTSLDLGNGVTVTAKEELSGEYDRRYTAMIIKYNNKGEAQWADSYANKNYSINSGFDDIKSDNGLKIIQTKDGGYVVGGSTYSASENICIGNEIHLRLNKNSYGTGMLIKYNAIGQAQWAKSIPAYGYNYSWIRAIEETQDEGYLVGGEFTFNKTQLDHGIILQNDVQTLKDKTYYSEGLLIKYDATGQTQWAKNIGGADNDEITDIVETNLGTYIAVGAFKSSQITLANEGNLTNQGDYDAMLIKIDEKISGKEEIEVFNNRKEFQITTSVEKIEGEKGGTISGESDVPYEKVKYGDSSIKPIKMTPNTNYEILKITVNGQEYDFEKAEDGSYTMPAFTNVTENKHIVVTYGLADNKLTLHKIDGDTKVSLAGAEFKLQQKVQVDNTIGALSQNSTEYSAGIASPMIQRAQYTFTQQDTQYVPTNSKTYQLEHGGTEGIANTTANSMMIINLGGKTGKYEIEVNAEISSEEGKDFGYATLLETADNLPSYDDPKGRLMCISGNIEAQNYTYELEGGKTYYLFFGYRKDGSGDVGEDKMTINHIKLYTPSYNFVETEGTYQLNKENKSSYSYLPIDLTTYTGEYMLTVNAEMSDSTNTSKGYVTVTDRMDIPNYDTEEGTFINITGTQNATDYTTTLQGGKMYYLHLGYDTENNEITQQDNFIIHQVKVTPKEYILTTGENGKGSLAIPFGIYQITETKAPEGYLLVEEPVEFAFAEGGDREVTIENAQSNKVIVHHYIKGTTQQLVEDEVLQGKEGEVYTTIPQMDLEKYTLDTDEEGKYIVPENASGRYTQDTIEVVYEYVQKDTLLTIHHYIENTANAVPLANGQTAQDVVQRGKEGELYTTSAIPEDQLDAEYEVSIIPENHEGSYHGREIEITYYYKKIERKITLKKYQEDGITPLAGAKFTIQPKGSLASEDNIYTTDEVGEIELILRCGEYEVTEIEAPKGYVLPEDPMTPIHVTRDLENSEINIINTQEKGKVITHHYIEGTTTHVPLMDGNVAQDVVKIGEIGDIYATKGLENVSKRYELSNKPDNASGFIAQGTIEVTYYYREKEKPVVSDSEITKTSTKQNIIKADEKIPYTITFTGEIDKYKGNATLTIVDILPYKIDTTQGKSDLAGGIYNEEDQTITWTEQIEGIDTYANGKKQIHIEKTIQVTYKELDIQQANLSNRVTGNIDFPDMDTSETIGTTNEIPIDIVTQVEVTLQWIDTEEQKEKRPEKLIIQIKREDEVIDSKEITITKDDKENKVKFEGLPKYDEEGNLIHYTVDETVLPGEEHKDDLASYDKTITNTTITNTFVNRLIEEAVIENHIDIHTKEILFTQTHEGNEGDEYDIQPRTFDEYELVTQDKEGNSLLPENATGIITKDTIVVNYYYTKKDKPIISDANITKTSTKENIIKANEKVPYTITFTGEIDQYKGDATITIVDTLPYKIDTTQGKSDLAGGIYDEENDTITWIETMDGIDTYTNGKELINIQKTIELTYKDLDIYQATLSNGVTGKIDLPDMDTSETKGTTNEIPIDIVKEIEVTLQWVDTEEQKEKRPDKLIIQIKKDGEVVDSKEITITKEDTQNKVKFEGLPKYDEDGNLIDYTIDEAVLPGEDHKNDLIFYDKNITGTTITNTFNNKIQEIGVIENHIDIDTQEIIYTKTHKGKQGDAYDIQPRTFDEYELVTQDKEGNSLLPDNAKGNMTSKMIEVKYYYKRKAEVEVQYLEKGTDNILAESQLIKGLVGDKYKVKRKQLAYCKFIEAIGQTEGIMTKDKIIIKYYYEKQIFNLKVDTWITNITMNGLFKGGKTFAKKEEICKLDIRKEQVNTADVRITYKIRITNQGEIEGSVGKLTNTMPMGYTFYPQDNKINWMQSGGILTTSDLQNDTIEPGESKDIELVLRWTKGATNFGEKLNTVSITEVKNPANYQDAKQEDNIAKANMIITIITGMDLHTGIFIMEIMLVVLVTTLGILIFYKKKRAESK